MADPNSLLQKAQHAFQNVNSSSTDGEKYAARAKSLARRIIRKYPGSREANRAQFILEQLGEQVPTGGSQFSAIINKYCLPGWALRLMQTISVLVGVNLLLPTLIRFSFSGISDTGLLTLAAGGLLVSLPWLAVFDRLVARAKTMIFSEEDWDRDVTHMPTQQDRDELVEAFLEGNTMKRIFMAVALFILSSYLIIFGAIIYVIGTRKALDDIEGWLLERKVLTSALTASAPVTADKSKETTSETGDDFQNWKRFKEEVGDASDKLDDHDVKLRDSTASEKLEVRRQPEGSHGLQEYAAYWRDREDKRDRNTTSGTSISGAGLTRAFLFVGLIILMAVLMAVLIAVLAIFPYIIAALPLIPIFLVLGIIKP